MTFFATATAAFETLRTTVNFEAAVTFALLPALRAPALVPVTLEETTAHLAALNRRLAAR